MEEEKKVVTIAGDGQPKDDTQPDPRDKELENLRKLHENTLKENEELGRTNNVAINLARAIASDPDLATKVRDKYERMYGGGVQNQEPSKQSEEKNEKKDVNGVAKDAVKVVDDKINRLEQTQREKIIKDFEDKSGIGSLDNEIKQKIRGSIETYLNKWGYTVMNVPLDVLEDRLYDAKKNIDVETAIKEGKMEAFAESYMANAGSMPSLNGRTIKETDKNVLTDEQKRIAEKMGLDIGKVQEVAKNTEKEGLRVPKSER
jgi:hypothetical protein